MIAVVPVRSGVLPAGGDETVAECGGRALVVGEGAAIAAKALAGLATTVTAWETEGFAPARWAAVLGRWLTDEAVVVLPASPDGRDLAPRLAQVLGRALLAGAIAVTETGASVARQGGLVIEDVRANGPFVATLLPGVRGVQPGPAADLTVEELDLLAERFAGESPGHGPDVEVVEVLAPDVATMDLAEAPRILGGGAGLDGAERFAVLGRVATALNASVGATRVITDRHWVPHQRQIGTTGVVVDPQLYIAFGISGAVQHTSGLGDPEHIVSVNVDPSCPMMQLSDLAIVSDANAVLDELALRLGVGDDDGDGDDDGTGPTAETAPHA